MLINHISMPVPQQPNVHGDAFAGFVHGAKEDESTENNNPSLSDMSCGGFPHERRCPETPCFKSRWARPCS